MMTLSANNILGCEPPVEEKAGITVSKGVALKAVHQPLVRLKVVFGSADFPSGSEVFIRRPQTQLEVVEVEGQQVALVEASKVVFRQLPANASSPASCKLCQYFIACPGCGRGRDS